MKIATFIIYCKKQFVLFRFRRQIAKRKITLQDAIYASTNSDISSDEFYDIILRYWMGE